jgi:lipopolysaccharide assembly protein A
VASRRKTRKAQAQAAAQGQVAGGQGQGQPAPAKPHAVRRTRFGGAWVSIVLFAVVLLLLLVFILENDKKVSISFFGAHGHLPLGVAMLLAAVLGILLVVIPGVGRIIQLRRTARRHSKQDVAAAAGSPAATQQGVGGVQQQGAGQPTVPGQAGPPVQPDAAQPGVGQPRGRGGGQPPVRLEPVPTGS